MPALSDSWKIMRNTLALIFLVAPFYYHDNIGGTGLNIPSNITVWASVALFTWLSVNAILKESLLVLPKRVLLILAFPLLATISGFVSGVSEPMEWAFRVLFLWGSVLFLLGLFQFRFTRSQKDKTLLILLIGGFFHAIAGLMQYFQPEGVIIYLPTVEGTNIATGLFQQINIHASFQATMALTGYYLFNRPIAKSNSLIASFILITVVLSAFIVFISGSRVGFLSLLLGICLYLPICWAVIKRNKKRTSMLLLAVLIAFLSALLSDGWSRLVDKSETHTEYATSERIGIYRVSAELIEKSPFIGHGLGSFESVWQYQKADFQDRHPHYSLIQDYVVHPHNELLFWQVEGGLLATLGILITFFTVFIIAWKSKAGYSLVLLFPFALHNQVELPFHISAVAWFTCLLLLYLAVSHAEKVKISDLLSRPMSLLIKIINYIVLIIAVLFLLHSDLANRELKYATELNEEADLSVPLANPYFSQIAEDFRMQQLFRLSALDQNTVLMEAFNKWQLQAIKSHPTDLNFKLLIASYHNLQNREEACETAKVAARMYSSNEEFENYSKACSE